MTKTLPFTREGFEDAILIAIVIIAIIVFVVSLTYLLFFNDEPLLTVGAMAGVIISGIFLLLIIGTAM